ncbi:MAG TPA: response regulator [Pyrinomonadaceae bacterium]|nr:response regulator [Pyrinomonadaceae bacterium]
MKRSVLYLDDEPGCLDLFREVFGVEYDVRTASSTDEARRMLAARPADVVISDETMPGTTGKVFLAEVADSYPATYRVLLTGRITVGVALREISAGVVQAFVTKPWSRGDINRVLERGLADALLCRRAEALDRGDGMRARGEGRDGED